MHVFPLQYSQLPGVNCVCRYHGGRSSPASSDSHQLNIICTIAQILCNNYYWSRSLSSLKLGWLARCIGLC